MAQDSGTGRSNPPFASKTGAPQNQGGSGAKGFDYPRNAARTPGGAAGRDFTKESRPQPAFKTQAGLPNAESIPAGGKDLKADPGATAKGAGGVSGGVQGVTQKPFKGLKG
jgi:hypothetical protein